MHTSRCCGPASGGARYVKGPAALPLLPNYRTTTTTRLRSSSKDLQQPLPTVEGTALDHQHNQDAHARHRDPASVLERIQKKSERDARVRSRAPQTIPAEVLPLGGRRDAAWWRQSRSDSQPRSSNSSNSQKQGFTSLPMKRRRHDGLALVRLNSLVPAGKSAGVIAHTLRDEQVILLEFTSVLAILKGLRAVALANSFLNQHRSALSFVFLPIRQQQPQQPGEANKELHASNMLVWTRAIQQAEKHRFQRQPGLAYIDFALDVRKQWKQAANVSIDTAYCMADNIYSQLLASAQSAAAAKASKVSKAHHRAYSQPPSTKAASRTQHGGTMSSISSDSSNRAQSSHRPVQQQTHNSEQQPKQKSEQQQQQQQLSLGEQLQDANASEQVHGSFNPGAQLQDPQMAGAAQLEGEQIAGGTGLQGHQMAHSAELQGQQLADGAELQGHRKASSVQLQGQLGVNGVELQGQQGAGGAELQGQHTADGVELQGQHTADGVELQGQQTAHSTLHGDVQAARAAALQGTQRQDAYTPYQQQQQQLQQQTYSGIAPFQSYQQQQYQQQLQQHAYSGIAPPQTYQQLQQYQPQQAYSGIAPPTLYQQQQQNQTQQAHSGIAPPVHDQQHQLQQQTYSSITPPQPYQQYQPQQQTYSGIAPHSYQQQQQYQPQQQTYSSIMPPSYQQHQQQLSGLPPTLEWSMEQLHHQQEQQQQEHRSPAGLVFPNSKDAMPRGIVGPIIMNADTSQAVLVFVALKFVQKRLNHEHSGASITLTVFRNTLVPRVDGRNGFVFELYLMPNNKVAQSQGARPWRPPPPMTHSSAAGEPTGHQGAPQAELPPVLRAYGYGVRHQSVKQAGSARMEKARGEGGKGVTGSSSSSSSRIQQRGAGRNRSQQSGRVRSKGEAGSKDARQQRHGPRGVGGGGREGQEVRDSDSDYFM